MRPRCVSAAALLCLLAAAAAPADPATPGTDVGIAIVAFGVYAPSAQYGRMPPRFRQDAIVEVTETGMPRLIERTDRIAARACTRFGLQYRGVGLAPSQSIVAEVRVTHPMLTRPDGRRSASDTYEVPVTGGVGWTGFDFDEPWEMAPGTWTFAFVYAGRVVAQQRFEVTAPPAGAPQECARAVASGLRSSAIGRARMAG